MSTNKTSLEKGQKAAEALVSGIVVLRKEKSLQKKGYMNNHLILTLENGIKHKLDNIDKYILSWGEVIFHPFKNLDGDFSLFYFRFIVGQRLQNPYG